MKKIRIDWFTKLILRFWPSLAMVRLAKKMGITNPLFNEAHNLFSKIRRIDLLPLKFGYRGFIIVLDKKPRFISIRIMTILFMMDLRWENMKKATSRYLIIWPKEKQN